MNKPTSRWQRSTITFGPIGRVAWSIALFVVAFYPILVALRYGYIWICLYVGGIPMLLVLYPLAMRDVWKKVRNPDYEPPIVLTTDRPTLREGESLHDRRPPRRW